MVHQPPDLTQPSSRRFVNKLTIQGNFGATRGPCYQLAFKARLLRITIKDALRDVHISKAKTMLGPNMVRPSPHQV
jgi:hypothetical protein